MPSSGFCGFSAEDEVDDGVIRCEAGTKSDLVIFGVIIERETIIFCATGHKIRKSVQGVCRSITTHLGDVLIEN